MADRNRYSGPAPFTSGVGSKWLSPRIGPRIGSLMSGKFAAMTMRWSVGDACWLVFVVARFGGE
jgi:hypothetical protein